MSSHLYSTAEVGDAELQVDLGDHQSCLEDDVLGKVKLATVEFGYK